MFVQFKQTCLSLQASLVETSRRGASVRQDHNAGLGIVSLTLTIASRMEFWTKLYQRLDALPTASTTQSAESSTH
jgi:hypothetical protein